MAPVSRQKAQRGEHLWLINEVADQHSHVKGIDPTITTREIVAFLRPEVVPGLVEFEWRSPA